MTTQPTITGPLHRTNPFRTCSDADVSQPWNTATQAAMLALPYSQVGDTCCVSTSTDDSVWLAVAKDKYTHGLNCLAGSSTDWLYPIDRLRGTTYLTDGHAFVYIPGLTASAVVIPGYSVFIGEPGALSAHAVANGIQIDSTSPFDGSLVSYDVTP